MGCTKAIHTEQISYICHMGKKLSHTQLVSGNTGEPGDIQSQRYNQNQRRLLLKQNSLFWYVRKSQRKLADFTRHMSIRTLKFSKENPPPYRRVRPQPTSPVTFSGTRHRQLDSRGGGLNILIQKKIAAVIIFLEIRACGPLLGKILDPLCTAGMFFKLVQP